MGRGVVGGFQDDSSAVGHVLHGESNATLMTGGGAQGGNKEGHR